MVYTAKMNAALASQEYEVRGAAGAKPTGAPLVAARRKMKSYEKIYESAQPGGKPGTRHLSRRRGMQYGGVERMRFEAAAGQQSLSTIQTASYRQLSLPEQAAGARLPPGQGVAAERKQSQCLPTQPKMSRSAQRGGGRVDRTLISDHTHVLKLVPEQREDFMTVQSHKNGHKAMLLANSGQSTAHRDDRLRTIAAKDGYPGGSLRSQHYGESATIADFEANSYGQAQLKARAVDGGKRERPSVTRAYQSLVERQGAREDKSYEYGLKKAPRPRSNVRSNQRASVRPTRPEAAAFNFGTASLGLRDLTTGVAAVTSHRYQQAPQPSGNTHSSIPALSAGVGASRAHPISKEHGAGGDAQMLKASKDQSASHETTAANGNL